MNRRQKIVLSVTGIFIVLLILIGLTYAYFLTRITGNGNPTSISVTTANLELLYGDGTTSILTSETPLMPSSTPIGTKDFTVTNNGDDSSYVVVFEDVIVKYAVDTVIGGQTVTAGTPTTFNSNDFVYTLTCTKKDGTTCNGVENETFPMDGGIVVGNDIDKDDVHSYVLTLYYLDNGFDQSADMNKTLNGKVNIDNKTMLFNSNMNQLGINLSKATNTNEYFLSKRYNELKKETGINNLEWTTYYVSPLGDNSQSGTIDAPLKTVTAALEKPGENIKIIYPDGEYNSAATIEDINNLNKNLWITCEDGVYSEKYTRPIRAEWELYENNIYYWTSTSSYMGSFKEVSLTQDNSYFDEVDSLEELSSVSDNSWYKELNSEGKVVIYVKLSSGLEPTSGEISVDITGKIRFISTNPNKLVYISNVVVENNYIHIGQPANYVTGENSYKTTFIFENVKAATLSTYDNYNYYIYGSSFGDYNSDGIHFEGNPLTYIEKTSVYDTELDGITYKGRTDDNGNGVGYEIEVEVFRNGLGDTTYKNNSSTLHHNWKVIRVGGNYGDAQSRPIHDVNNSVSLNYFLNVNNQLGVVSGHESESIDYAVGAEKSCNTRMYLYECSSENSLSELSMGRYPVSGESKILQYNSKYKNIGSNVINWNGVLPNEETFFLS